MQHQELLKFDNHLHDAVKKKKITTCMIVFYITHYDIILKAPDTKQHQCKYTKQPKPYSSLHKSKRISIG